MHVFFFGMLKHAEVNTMILYFLNFQKHKSGNLVKAKDIRMKKTKIEKEKSLIRRKFLRKLGFSLAVPCLKEKLKDGTGLCLYIRETIRDMLCLMEGKKSCPVDVESPHSSSSVKSDNVETRCRICFRSGKKGIRLVTVISAVWDFAVNIVYLDVLNA